MTNSLDSDNLFPYVEDSSTLVVTCAPPDYSASVICRAVEDCDAHVLNLNVAGERTESGLLKVWLRISHRRPEAVTRSLERFGYGVESIDSHHDDVDDDRARRNARQLLRILDV